MFILYNFWLFPLSHRFIVRGTQVFKYIVVSYDEIRNTILEEEQMGILVRFFNETIELVETRYFDSTFLKRPNSTNL